VGVGEEDAALGEPVHVGRTRLRVADAGEVAVTIGGRVLVGQAADPVVEVINGDQQDVVAGRRCPSGSGCR